MAELDEYNFVQVLPLQQRHCNLMNGFPLRGRHSLRL